MGQRIVNTVLVTGAGGFVCRHIVDALLDAGYRVIAVDRAFDEMLYRRWSQKAVAWVEGDAENLPEVAAEYLIHGAAITASPEECGQTAVENLRANLNPLFSAVAWAHEKWQRKQVRRAVFISSGGVFRGSPEPVLTETTPTTVLGTYAVAKETMESLVRTLHKEYGQDFVSIRLGNIYGTMEYSRAARPRVSKVAMMLQQAFDSGTINIPAQSDRHDWTLAADVGRAVVALLQAPVLEHDLYHVTSGEALNDLAIAQTIQAVLPQLEIVQTDAVKQTFRGILTSQRLQPHFNDWTLLRDGIRGTVAWIEQERESA